MLPSFSEASTGSAELEKRRHVLRIDELEALNPKGGTAAPRSDSVYGARSSARPEAPIEMETTTEN